MKYRISLILLFLITSSHSLGQTLYGTILSADTQLPISANVLIKDENDRILQFAIADSNGQYRLDLSKLEIVRDQVTLEATKYGYLPQSSSLNLKKIQILKHDFSLESSAIKLKEIVVKANEIPIQIKNDTVTYNPDAYKDGSELVVEDVLRKLPGITILEDGSVQFKGKDVSKVLLEGDDLFDNNYVVGTRNISAEIIDKVQAIENFTDNPLLRGLSDSNDVALNLKLKKDVLDLSGNGYLGLGIDEMYIVGSNFIGLYEKHKNFTSLSSNNIGKNNSPYDYFTNQPSKDQQEISGQLASKIISNDAMGSALETYRTYDNSLKVGSANHIIKHNTALNSRLNFNFHEDDIKNNRSTFSSYFLQNLNVRTADAKVKTPKLFKLIYDLTYKPNDQSLLEFNQIWSDEKVNISNLFTSNNSQDITTNKSIYSYFLKNSIKFSQRVKKDKAILFNGYYASNAIPQLFTMSPTIDISTDEYDLESILTQSIYSKKNKANIRGALIGVDKNLNKYALMMSGDWRKEKLSSNLRNDTLSIANNKLSITNYAYTISSFYKLKLNRLSIKPSVNFVNHWTQLEQDIDSTFTKHFINPSLNLNYKLTENSALFSNSSITQYAQPTRYLYKDYILQSARNINYNEPNFTYQNVGNILIGFSHYDLYNQFKFVSSFSYRHEKNQFLSNNLIFTNYNLTKYGIFPESNTNLGLGVTIEKYLSLLTSSIRLDSHNTIYKYKNLVNNSGLRENRSFISFNELYLSTAFKIPVNFQNTLQVKHFQSGAKNSINVDNTSLQNQFKILFNPTGKKLYASALIEYYNPNLGTKDNYTFLDIDVRYTMSPSIKLTFEARNVTGNDTFKQIQVSDFYKTSNTLHLNKPYVLLRLDFRF